MQQTKHYGLNQWELTDRILMSDFNADNDKIDTALGTLSRDLPRKLGRMEIIESHPSSGDMNTATGYGLPLGFSWSEWEYVCFLCHYPGKTTDDSVPLSFCLDYKTGGPTQTKYITTMALPGYLVVTLPRHNASSNFAGFVLSDRFIPFSFQFSFQNLNQYSFCVKNYTQTLIAPNNVMFGGR